MLIPYFYTRDWWERNVDTPEAYTKWRNPWGAYYLDIQDARDLYYRHMAFGHGWVGDTPGFNGDLNAVLHSIKAKALFVLSPQDQFFPPPNIEAEVNAIPRSARRLDRFGCRAPDLLQRRSECDTGNERCHPRVPARAQARSRLRRRGANDMGADSP